MATRKTRTARPVKVRKPSSTLRHVSKAHQLERDEQEVTVDGRQRVAGQPPRPRRK
jgi:hypothetical protein